jgi:hypothetical protein
MQTIRQDRSNRLETVSHVVVAVVLFAFAMALNVTILAGAVSEYIA